MDNSKKNLILSESFKALLRDSKSNELIDKYIPAFIKKSLLADPQARIADMKLFMGINIMEAL